MGHSGGLGPGQVDGFGSGGQIDLDLLVSGCREILSDKIRPDGEFSMPPVDKDGQHDPRRPAEINQKIHRCPDGPACKEDIVHKKDLASVDRNREMALPQKRDGSSSSGKVIPVKGHIHRSDRRLNPLEGDDEVPQTTGQKIAPLKDTYKVKILWTLVLLKDFVSHAPEDAINPGSVEKDTGRWSSGRGHIRNHRDLPPGRGKKRTESATSISTFMTNAPFRARGPGFKGV
jgi:hypothetical protein